jgi:hypothetical protein
MAVVGGAAINREIAGIVRIGAPFGHARLVGRVVVAAGVVGIGLIGEGRGQEDHRRRRRAFRRQDVEGQPVLAGRAGEVQGIGAAIKALRHGELEIGFPAAIAEVVGVEMDGGVVGRRVAPVHLGAGPVGAGHGAGRGVDEHAMAGLQAGVGDGLGGDVEGKIPGGQRVRRIGPSGVDAGMQCRRLQLAGEMGAGLGDVARGEEERAGAIRQAQARLGGLHGDWCSAQRLLAKRDLARISIGAQPYAHPLPQRPGRAGLDSDARRELGPGAVRADTEGHRGPRLLLAEQRGVGGWHSLQPRQRRPCAGSG